MKKILSVVVPSYNVSRYLDKTLSSLVACSNINKIEIIVVNDGSSDNTNEIACKFVEEFPLSVILINKENGGHGSTINVGLRKASGDYLIVVDGDDWVETKELERFVGYLESCTDDVIVSGFYKNYFLENKETICAYKEPSGFQCDMSYIVKKGYYLKMTDICYRRQLLTSIDLKIQEKTFYVDEEYCTIPMQFVKTISFSGINYYHYRIGDINQSISRTNTINRVDHKIRVLKHISEATDTKGKSDWNSKYINKKKIGLIKSIMEIYFCFNLNKREGRKSGRLFFSEEKKIEKEACKRCRIAYIAFNIINLLHISY